MGMLILGEKYKSREELLSQVALTAFTIGASLHLDENKTNILPKDSKLELTIMKHYNNEEQYFSLILEREDSVLSTYNLLNFKIGKLYRYGVTDQANYPRLIYNFALTYLRLNPNQIISTYGDQFYTHDDMERLSKEGGYFENWCYSKLPWQEPKLI